MAFSLSISIYALCVVIVPPPTPIARLVCVCVCVHSCAGQLQPACRLGKARLTSREPLRSLARMLAERTIGGAGTSTGYECECVSLAAVSVRVGSRARELGPCDLLLVNRPASPRPDRRPVSTFLVAQHTHTLANLISFALRKPRARSLGGPV